MMASVLPSSTSPWSVLPSACLRMVERCLEPQGGVGVKGKGQGVMRGPTNLGIQGSNMVGSRDMGGGGGGGSCGVQGQGARGLL